MARCVGVFKSLNFLLSLVCVLLHCQKQIRVQAGTHKRGWNATVYTQSKSGRIRACGHSGSLVFRPQGVGLARASLLGRGAGV